MSKPLFSLALAGDKVDLRPYFGTPEQVAALVAFLASPEAPRLTAQVLGFDGTRLSVWSHPTVLGREHRDEWTLDEFANVLAAGPLAALEPDELGVAVLSLMGADVSLATPR